jgi:hypothetical protein
MQNVAREALKKCKMADGQAERTDARNKEREAVLGYSLLVIG